MSFFIKILPPIFSLHLYIIIFKKILYLNLFIKFLRIAKKIQQDNYNRFLKMYIYSPTLPNIIIYYIILLIHVMLLYLLLYINYNVIF